MENTPENYIIAVDAFDRLSWMPRYPELPRQIEERVKRLMKIAHNKPILEVILDAIQKYGLKSVLDNFIWDHDWVMDPGVICTCDTCKSTGRGVGQQFTGKHTEKFGSPDRNDLDWLIETIGETCEELPTQKGIRRIYCESGLRPFDGKRMSDVEIETYA